MRSVSPLKLLLILVFLLSSSLMIQSPAAAESHTAEINGMEMHYETSGQGEPLVLLHGFMRSCRAYDPFIDDFSKQYRLIVPDLRGHGGSTNPSGEFSMKQSARDIFALLEHLKIDKFKAVGISAGAVTLLHMATQQPDRIEALILIGSGIYYPGPCRESLGKIDPDSYSEAGWNQLRRTHHHGDDQIRMLFKQLSAFTETYDDLTFTPPHLAIISARTLLVHGDRDYCFPVTMVTGMYEAIPDAYLWVIPRGGHVPIYDKWAPVFSENALAFLGGAWSK